jgi:serine phosphatase RsbU (regulator of sigma subunit)
MASPTADDMLLQAEREPDPRRQIDLMLKTVRMLSSFGAGNLNRADELLQQAEQRAQALGYARGMARSEQCRAEIAFFRMEYEKAFASSQRAIAQYEASNDIEGLAEVYMGLAMATWDTGNYADGLDMIFKSIQYHEQLGNKEMAAITSYMAGSFYYDLKDFEDAKHYYERGYRMAKEAGSNNNNLARNIIGLANIAMEAGQYDEARARLEEAIALQERIGDTSGLGRSYNDLGRLHQRLGQPQPAEHFFVESRKLREKLANVTALVTTLIDLGAFYLEQGRLEEAEANLRQAVELSHQVQAKAKRARALALLSDLCRKLRRWEEAYGFLSTAQQLKEEVAGEDFNFRMRRLEKRLEVEKKEQEAEIYRLRNVELKDAYERIDKKNRDITASITYAKRIQEALLPDMQAFGRFVQDHFVFFRPRDIVSGDFYWFTEKDGAAYVAAVDCTGHGVPGAFMSMIGHNLLNQAVHLKDLAEPGQILQYLHQAVQQALHQQEGDNRDGMDMGLCRLDPATRTLAFAGAKQALLHVRQGQATVVKGDRMPIGGMEMAGHAQGFATQQISWQPGDRCYLMSDGVQDQFGGPEGKKFKTKALHQLLAGMGDLPMPQQQARLEAAIGAWMGEERQIDDMMVLGWRW